MTEDFCNRTARRIRKFGHAPKTAVRIARFCHVSMVSVCGALLFVSYQSRAGVEKESSGSFDPMMGAMLDPSLKSMAGEEDISLRRLPIAVPSVENLLNRGHGNTSLGVRASLHLLSFTIHHRSPAL